MTPIVQAAAIAAVTLGTGAATLTAMNRDIPDLDVPEAAWVAGGALDGRDFAIAATIAETGERVEDVLRFAEGRFHSVNCEAYCTFGWSAYRTWTGGDTIHFTATTRCPEAPHTVVWMGTVSGDEIAVALSWTTRRWYWTRQITGSGAGADTGADTVPAAPRG